MSCSTCQQMSHHYLISDPKTGKSLDPSPEPKRPCPPEVWAGAPWPDGGDRRFRSLCCYPMTRLDRQSISTRTRPAGQGDYPILTLLLCSTSISRSYLASFSYTPSPTGHRQHERCVSRPRCPASGKSRLLRCWTHTTDSSDTSPISLPLDAPAADRPFPSLYRSHSYLAAASHFSRSAT